jgi:uncharacterized protein
MSTMPQISAEEVRVLGSMIEKSQATPEYYPMTLNSITAACNQKSSRDPVMQFDEDFVEKLVTMLREKGLVAFSSGNSRVMKYLHRAGQNGLGLTPAQAAALSIIMLRGPQTTAEIKARSGRQFTYPSNEFVQDIIASLMTDERPYLEEAPRRRGQKEVRYRHRFHPWPELDDDTAEPFTAASIVGASQQMQERVERLEAEAKALRAVVDRLAGELQSLRENLGG